MGPKLFSVSKILTTEAANSKPFPENFAKNGIRKPLIPIQTHQLQTPLQASMESEIIFVETLDFWWKLFGAILMIRMLRKKSAFQ